MACSAVYGGLTIDAAQARANARAQGSHGWGPEAAAPAPSFALAAGEASAGLPRLIGEAFPGRAGAQVLFPGWRQGAWRAGLGVAWREDREPGISFEGSELAFTSAAQADEGEFYASVQRRHWGPGWTGSLILDGGAAAVPALGWRRTATRAGRSARTSWIGPWGADLFVGRLRGHREPERPSLIGMRLTLAPFDGITIGLARTLQWGGRGRDERWSSLRNALLGNDNVGFGGINPANEPGNQLAGIDVHGVIHAATHTAVYAQLVGEDEAGKFPSRNMVLAGIESRWVEDGHTLWVFAEYADLLAGRVSRDPRPYAAYRHGVYLQGYTHEGLLLGHPAGGDLKLGSVGALLRAGPVAVLAMVAIGRAEPSAQRFAVGALLGFDAAVQWHLDERSTLQAGTTWWSDNAGRRHAASLRWRSGW